jgi:gluconate 2-dehydrogenase gamma chain
VPRTYKVSRRNFLGTAIAATVAVGGVACTGKSGSPWRFISVNEARTLMALCDQIIPPDQDPGASWAGVANYIDRQLCGSLKRYRKSYREGIAGVEQSSRVLHNTDFSSLSEKQQNDLMHLLEEGRAPGEIWKKISSSDFFSLLVEHTRQGFYGDPRHGGNRDAAAWKMLGLPYPPIRGRLRYDLTKL